MAFIAGAAALSASGRAVRSLCTRHAGGRAASSRVRCAPRMDAAGAGIYDPATRPADVRVVVFGATGYIGRFVVFEFVRRGYEVVAFARRRAGVGGKKGEREILDDMKGARVVFGDVTDPAQVAAAFEDDEVHRFTSTIVVSCLASRSGGIEDSNRIDYGASRNALEAGRAAGAGHFILLSAVCVQKPLLEFQRAKLRLEEELAAAAKEDPNFSFSVVRPTAFFKSLAGQVERVKKGASYIMFGDGELCKCNALSERDLARFMALCATDESKRNAVLPVGGPGEAVTPKQQADIIFRLLGKEPKYQSVPIVIMDGVIGILGAAANVLPFLRDPTEFGRIGRYYASEDMVGPSFGEDTLEDFFANAMKEGGMADQDLGDASYF